MKTLDKWLINRINITLFWRLKFGIYIGLWKVLQYNFVAKSRSDSSILNN